jgi:nucleotide-binding universal stress UspA family protein
MKIMVAYDGTLQAKEALVYGMDKAREKDGEVVVLHVFNSPMFMDYDAIDAEIRARVESKRFIEEAKTIIREQGAGVKSRLYSTEGNPSEEVISFARAEKADLLLCTQNFKSIINKYRKFAGSSELAGEAAKLQVAALSTNEM